MNTRKALNYFLLTGLLLGLFSCKQDLFNKVHYTVTLDSENTYKVGEPVSFNIEGAADQIMFYSGETGHQFQYKDRTSVPFEDIDSISMTFNIQPRFGDAGGLDIYVTDNEEFKLSGEDGEADRAAIKAMYEGGMQGWDRLDWEEGPSSQWKSFTIDLSRYAESFAIAFHWHPSSFEKTKSQRTYWLNGTLSVNMKGVEPSTKNLRDLEVVSVMMNEEVDPYLRNNSNGSMIFNSNAAQYNFQGCAATALDYDLDGWVFSRPMSLNSVSRDQGTSVKSILHYPTRFEYTYDTPGTYFATFLGLSETVQGRSEQVKKIRVTITN